jgi:hypothetical protein
MSHTLHYEILSQEEVDTIKKQCQNLADGPPWSEDEDLQSPVVSSRHKKGQSSATDRKRSKACSTAVYL